MTTTAPHDAPVSGNGKEPDDKLTPPIDPSRRHRRDSFHVAGEGMWTIAPDGHARCVPASGEEDLRAFRFSRLGDQGTPTPVEVLEKVATAMVDGPQVDSSPGIPAGYTYLGQFVDHDLTGDRTEVELGDDVTVEELKQGRSPALDLDSVYGRGPVRNSKFYEDDGVHLKLGATVGINVPAGDPVTKLPLDGFDLPRAGEVAGGSRANKRAALIPDGRNDENLAVAQTHAAFIRFHNVVVDELAASTPTALLFEKARREVVLHYQWMLREDFLPRIVDKAIVDDVFTGGRRFFEVVGRPKGGKGRRIRPGDTPTMPIEFSVATYRLGHSMIRAAYNWNRVFNFRDQGALVPASLLLLFTFTGANGNFQPSGIEELDDPDSGTLLRLPTNWIADFRRLYDFGEAGRSDLVVEPGRGNVTRRIDTSMVNPLAELPLGSFNGRGTSPPAIERNLAFRNLVRANMVRLASGQQMAEDFQLAPLTPEQVLKGNGDANSLDLTADAVGLTPEQQAAFAAHTPLWFYILREAELNDGLLTGVGGRITAEVFHRAMEGSSSSIVRNPLWRPTLGRPDGTFHMVDLLLFAFEGKEELLNPLGDKAPVTAP